MQKVLSIKLMNEDKDIVDSDGKDKEWNDFSNDQCDLNTNQGEEANGG